MDRSRLLKMILFGIGQCALIVASVLIAAWVENLREERKELQVSRELLSQMLHELENDSASLKNTIPLARKQSLAANSMVQALVTGVTSTDSIRKFTAQLNWFVDYHYNVATYETFKSNGFNLISNGHLRLKIVQYYEHRADLSRSLARVSYEQLFYNHVPLLEEHFKDFSMFGGSVPVDFQSLRSNNKVIEFFRIWRDLMDVQYQSEKEFLAKTIDLIKSIRQELGKS
jgi:hypothetical protein